MQRKGIATIIATAAVIGGSTLATPASASTTADVRTTATAVVAVGAIPGLSGNRHQVHLVTHDGVVAPESTVRSYYCPSGAKVTPTWASSSCTRRGNYTLKNPTVHGTRVLIGRISSSGASASQRGSVIAKSTTTTRSVSVEVLMSIFKVDGGGFKVTGTVGGKSLVASPRLGAYGIGSKECGC